jgi:RNA polymerase sigma factor for flagellar operon FliA
MVNAQSAYWQVKHGTADDLVVSYAPLVKRLAYHLISRLPANVDVKDLIQVGMMGLLEAASHFQQDKGASFETFASIRIRGAMLDEVRREGWAPRSVMRRVKALSTAMRKVENRLGREASPLEVASEMDMSLNEYFDLVQEAATLQVSRLDHMGSEQDGQFEVADEQATSPLGDLLNADFQQDLANYIDGLPEREKLVLALYYEQSMNLKEIGLVLGVSESRVCQLHSQAVVRLRHRMLAWQEHGVPV